jgi:hypothetical protein
MFVLANKADIADRKVSSQEARDLCTCLFSSVKSRCFCNRFEFIWR